MTGFTLKTYIKRLKVVKIVKIDCNQQTEVLAHYNLMSCRVLKYDQRYADVAHERMTAREIVSTENLDTGEVVWGGAMTTARMSPN